MHLNRPELFQSGYFIYPLPVPETVKTWVKEKKWEQVDVFFSEWLKPSGPVFESLQQFHSFSHIETMISVRNSENEWEEDGIWHDDGSRVFAFSLSLTEDTGVLQGGCLEIQNIKTGEISSVITPPFGTAILFLTGRHGYLHRIKKVERGVRTILVGWCSE